MSFNASDVGFAAQMTTVFELDLRDATASSYATWPAETLILPINSQL